MEIALGIVVLVVVLAGLYVLLFRGRRPVAGPAGTRAEAGPPGVVLDIGDADPSSPVVQRLVHEAAARYFAEHPDAEEVEVRNAEGKVLGEQSRRAGPETSTPDLPPHLLEPHARPHRGPDVAGHLSEGSAPGEARFGEGGDPGQRTLADRLDLPESVRGRVRRPDAPEDVVRAILEAAGHEVRVDGDVLLAGKDAVVVVGVPLGTPVSNDQLSHAYLRFTSSGASRGVVVSTGLMYPDQIKRRQALAPNVGYAGLEGIQRMADAVAVGADPLRFATGAPIR